MHISLSHLAFKIPQHFPLHHPIFPPKPLHHQVSTQTHVNVLKGSGYLSEISKKIDHEEQYRIARSQVNRKVLELEGYSIEGISVGGQETCIIIPEFKSTFDIGRCPSRAINQNFLFITHAHLDHIVRFSTFVTNNFLWGDAFSFDFDFDFGFVEKGRKGKFHMLSVSLIDCMERPIHTLFALPEGCYEKNVSFILFRRQ